MLLKHNNEQKAEINTSSESESELEESQEEDNSWSLQDNKGLPSSTRNLRSRYSRDHKYSREYTKVNIMHNIIRNTSSEHKKKQLRSCHKRISLDERHTLTVYSHKMHDDTDDNDLDDIYSSR